MRVEVDRARCEANGVCASLAPAVFEVDEDDELRIRAVEVAQDELERVTQAVTSCPRNALFVVD